MYNDFPFFIESHNIGENKSEHSTILINDDKEDYKIFSHNLNPLKTVNDDYSFEELNLEKISTIPFSKDLELLSNDIIIEYNNDSPRNQIKEIKFHINTNEQNKNSKKLDNHLMLKRKRNIDEEIQTKKICSTNINSSSINKKRRRNTSNNRNKSFHRKKHEAQDNDNVLRKIQVHYISFITCFVNDIVEEFYPNKNIPKFNIIDYQIKKKVNHNYVEDLKKKTIGDILQLRVSPKMKKSGENANKEIYNKVLEKCPELRDFFLKNYITVFKKYYFDEDYKENQFNQVNGKIINLSSKTKTFKNLIQKNGLLKENIRKVVFNYYFKCHKRIKKLKKPKFTTK